MTRQSKQGERRARCPYKRQAPSPKTGPKKDNLPKGYLEQTNILAGTTLESAAFFPPVKSVK